MAEKRRARNAKKKDVLLPDVPDIPDVPVSEEPASEGKRRADETVDQLIESLFGEKKKSGGVAVAVREEAPAQAAVHSEEEAAAKDVVNEWGEEPLPFEPLAVQELSFKEEIEASASDFRLLLDMEYEEELGNAIGFEKIRAYHEKHMNGRKSARHAGASSEEFENQSQDTEVRRRYARERTGWFIRLGISALLFVLMLIYENAAWMTRAFDGPLDAARYPVPYILIGLQLLLLDATLCYRPLCEGAVRLLRFSPVDHSAHAVIFVFTVLYHIVILFLPIRQYPVLFLSPAALSITLLAASKLLDLYREGFCFDVVAARRQKYALLPRVSVGGVQSSARARLATGERNTNVWYLRPVGFVRNYFSNTATRGTQHRDLGAHLLFITALGTVIALFSFAGGAIPSQAFAVLFMSVLLCAPAISSLLSSLPLFFAACFCLRGKGAIIGEAVLERCGGRDTLILPDTDLFAAMEHAHFRLIDLCDAHRVAVLVRALLEKVQSPLATAFGVDVASRISMADLTLKHIGEGGVSAELRDGSATVAIGTASYVTELGCTLPATEELHGEAPHRLFVVMDGRACAAFDVRCTPSADLGTLLRELERSGLTVMVRSKDPCISEALFAELFPTLSKPIAVQRPHAGELELRTDRVDSCVVSLGSCKELARTYVICRRVRRVGHFGKLLQLLSVLVGGALSLLLMWAEYLLSALLIAAWMLVWCATYAGISYFYLRRPTDDI